MKAIILGGCGMVGSSIARDMIKSDDVENVVLADKRIDKSHVHRSVQSSDKVSWITLDVTNNPALVEAISGHDIVLNIVGPYYKYGIDTMRAAIQAGVSYLDICDDHDVTKSAFSLDDAARKAGVFVGIGFGAAPGLTNMLSKYAADQMDQVEEVRILWAAGLNDPVGFGALSHGIHMFEGDVPQFLDGHWVDVPAGSEPERVQFLGQQEESEIYYVGHPEPLTIPKCFPGIKCVVNKGGVLPSWASRQIMDFLLHGFMGTEPILLGDMSVVPKDFMIHIMQQAPEFRKEIESYVDSPSNIVVRGFKGNEEITYTFYFSGRQVPGTAISASIFAQMVCRGESEVGAGVVAPESAFDAKKYFAEFAKKGFMMLEEKTVQRQLQL